MLWRHTLFNMKPNKSDVFGKEKPSELALQRVQAKNLRQTSNQPIFYYPRLRITARQIIPQNNKLFAIVQIGNDAIMLLG